MSRRLTVAAARAALDRAKSRGRRDEIAAAAGKLAGALSRERAASPEAKALRGAAAAAKTAAKVAERAAAKAQRTGDQRDKRSAASLAGWATRRQRELERQRTQTPAPPKPARPRRGSGVRVYALRDDGGLFPARSSELSQQERELAQIVRDKFRPGAQVFGVYQVAETFDGARYYMAATVSFDKSGGVKWRWSPRALDAASAEADAEAMDADYNEGEASIVAVVALA